MPKGWTLETLDALYGLVHPKAYKLLTCVLNPQCVQVKMIKFQRKEIGEQESASIKFAKRLQWKSKALIKKFSD